MHFVDRKPKGEQPRLLTPHPDTSILYSSCPEGGTGRRKGLKIPGPQGCAGSIPALGTKTKRTGYDTNPHPFTFQNKPSHACSCNCKCKQEGVFLFPPSFLSPPPSAPQPLRTRRHVFLHILWAGSAYFPWGVGGASRASGGHPGSLSISAG